mmetsp:Transcript_35827/g.143184  ORF Transcript_35827/g.143184 Transcript_35827/m.143184 type:complete len:81 (+) Transcript_35827:1001-1243(+)
MFQPRKKKRFVAGLRQVHQSVLARTIKLLFIAPDIEDGACDKVQCKTIRKQFCAMKAGMELIESHLAEKRTLMSSHGSDS